MTLSPQLSRPLAIGLLLVAAALVYTLLIAPLAGVYSEQDAKISALALRAARVGGPANAAPQLAALQAGEGASPFWPGTTDEIAAAGLLERVKAVLQREGAVIESTEVMPASGGGDVHKIRLRLRFQAEIDQFQHVIHAAETMSPPLMVDRLAVRSTNSPREDAPPLAVELDLAGLAATSARGSGKGQVQ